jgi:hypothetical protein
MKNFTVAILFCMLMALGAFARHGSMQQPAQTPQTPGAAAQDPQHPGATPPSAAPQSQAGTVQTPDAQTPQTEPSQGSMRSGTPGVDDQVSALTSALNLTPDQQAKVKTILEDQHQQAVVVVNDPALAREAKVQKIHELRQGTIAKVRATLTSDEQKTKFDSMVQEKKDAHQGEQPQNNNPAPK